MLSFTTVMLLKKSGSKVSRAGATFGSDVALSVAQLVGNIVSKSGGIKRGETGYTCGQTLGGSQMHIDKEQVTDMLRSQGEHDKAHRAETALPREVDTEEDAGLLHQFDINTCDLPAETTSEEG